MFFFVFGIIALIVCVVFIVGTMGAKANNDKQAARLGLTASVVSFLLGIILVVASCVTFVPTGYTGIVTTFGKVENTTLDAGLKFKAPWQKVVQMDNRIQKYEVELACFSSDIQEVNTAVTIGYRINQANAMNIYKEIGKKYEDIIVLPQISEAVKAVIAQYDANSLMESRDEATARIYQKLGDALAKYNVDLSEVSVTDIDFTDTFTNAVEAKVEAQQQAEKAEAAAKQLKIEAQAKAEAEVIQAQAEAEKAKVEADAELYVAQQKAEANRSLNESLTGSLLQYYQITQVDALWNGELPKYMGGEGTVPVLNGVG